MDNLDKVIFKDKKFSDLLGEIYANQKKTQTQVSSLISELKPLVENIGDATLVVPLIKEYLEISVKNDDQLVKLATIIQRITQTASNNQENSFEISEHEKNQLLESINKLKKDD